jgi:hypothetical protein
LLSGNAFGSSEVGMVLPAMIPALATFTNDDIATSDIRRVFNINKFPVII